MLRKITNFEPAALSLQVVKKGMGISMNTMIIPQIKEIKAKDQNKKYKIKEYYLTPEYAGYVPAAVDLMNELEACGKKPITFVRNNSMGKEDYRIGIHADGIKVQASEPNGAFYAICTLYHLCLSNDGCVYSCEIYDHPDFEKRGFSDDISRGQISTFENFKENIRRIALLKMNVYMPYIEDTFQFISLPESGKYSDPVPQQEWRALVGYAKQYYVTIIPIINILGHWNKNSTLEAFDKYMLHIDGKTSGALDTKNPEVSTLVSTMLEEVIDVFGEGGYIHVGGDEAAEYTRIMSKEEAAGCYNGHFSYANEIVKKHNCKMMMYSDMYTPVYGDYQLGIDYIDQLNEDIEFVYWDYACRSEYKNINSLIEKKKAYYVSPATFIWDRFIPHYYYSWLNSKLITQSAYGTAKGVFLSSWCDGGLILREQNWFGIYAGANYSWNSSSDYSFEGLFEKFFSLFFGINHIDFSKMHWLFDYDKHMMDSPIEDAGKDEPMEFRQGRRMEIAQTIFREFWKDATLPVDAKIQTHMKVMLEHLNELFEYLSQLIPPKNQTAYQCILFEVKRSIIAAQKILLLKAGAYRNREEAKQDMPAIMDLAGKIQDLMEENRCLWFKINRKSEWGYVQAKYTELYQSFLSLYRYCDNCKNLTDIKKI